MLRFALPDPGEGLVEADITAWHVNPGDEVKVNDVLVEVETAKSLVEIPSPTSGVIARLLVAEGKTVNVGTPIVEIDDGSPDEPESPDTPDEPAGGERHDREITSSVAARVGATGKVLAKPLVRRLARDLGVDLASVTPTGPGGTVSRADVEKAAQPHVAASRVRRTTASNVAQSVACHVHVTEFTTIDVTATMDLVAELKRRREFRGLHVSPLLLHVKAVAMALSRHEIMNSAWDDGVIVPHEHINIGIAAATPRGLMVPVIRDADRLDLVSLCRELNRIVDVARDGKLQPQDYSGGTFSITNVGVFGIDTGTPIINGDESGILAMGAIARRPWVVGEGEEERIVPRWVTTLALSFDHQLVDGEDGSRFLKDVATILESPQLGLLF